ncbi:unnamed protein product [[Candida] boidinii]|uniref:Unnamed protein product n=1 Tax=Candida boidinii TaxID=5477 RepID=A0ACB5TH86_CANBO|nr:unnamed protein product [[Candida] boidinii]
MSSNAGISDDQIWGNNDIELTDTVNLNHISHPDDKKSNFSESTSNSRTHTREDYNNDDEEIQYSEDISRISSDDDDNESIFKNHDDLPFVQSSGLLKTEYRVIHWGEDTIIEETDDITKSYKLRLQLVTTFISFTMVGFTDATLGAVMHYIMEEYDINRENVSILFLIQAIGYITASFSMNFFQSRIGFHGSYLLSLILEILFCFGYFLKPSFPLLILNALMGGLGTGLEESSLNLFVGNLKHSNQLLGLLHSCYGVGCLISPILVTSLIHKGLKWNQYYLLLCAILTISAIMTLFLFKNETKEKFNYFEAKNNSKSENKNDEGEEQESGESIELQISDNSKQESVTILKCILNPYIQFFAFVLFIYVGSELTIGSWLYNYYITIKDRTDTVASYITSTYWLFMTLGRIVLAFVTGKYFEDKEYKAIILYSAGVSIGCLGFTIFHDFFILQIMSISLAGFCVGPNFATTIIISIKTLPKKYSNMGVGIVAGIGGSGAAVMPSIVGWLSENTAGGNGKGLIYFPFSSFLFFTIATVSWLFFYQINNEKLENRYNKKYQIIESI